MVARASTAECEASARRSVRVLLTGPDLSTPRGGIQTFVESILTAFKAVNEVEIDFFPVTLGMYRSESWFRKVTRTAGAVVPFWRRLRCVDIVHLNSSFDDRSIARDLMYLVLARLRSRRVVLMFHGGDPQRVSWLLWQPFQLLVSALLSQCEVILVLSTFQANGLRRACNALKQITQIPNFVDVGSTVARTNAERQEVRFLYLGRLHVDKGLREIVDAAQLLIQARQTFQITICGAGPEEGEIRRRIADSEIAKHVHFAGVVQGTEKAAILQSSDVLLLPSIHPEGFPFAVLEAFSAGMPVIATSVGALGEVVRHEENGLLVPPRDPRALAAAMKQVINDCSMRGRMGIEARQLAERHYSHDAMRRAFVRIYLEAARE